MVAERGPFVGMDAETVGHVDVEPAEALFGDLVLDLVDGIQLASRALPHDVQMASFVDDHRADLALVALFADSPNEFLAMSAERRLSEEQCHEFVTRDFMDFPPHGTSPLSIIESSRTFLENALSFTRIL